jgi:tRNA-2-methylthio-N6-dimethylallyladenosine synthase
VAVNYREDWEVLPFAEQAGSRVSAFVAISRGCNKNCSYCIVPTTRGVEVSRPLAEVLREVRWAVRAGAREVVLLGQTVNSYGRDLEPRTSFCELLQQVSEVTGLERIRFTSPHPQEIREDFLELVTTNPKICRHIHMPLQSGSDRILRAMNRNYRRKRYLEILTGIKERAPDMAFTTDIIVGFPGEQDEDFELTLEILELVRFQDSFSFAFSPRPGTAAAQLKDDVPHALKLERLQRWQSRQKQITSEGLQSWVGRCCEVLIERTSELDEQKLCGKTSQNITLNFEGGASESSGGSTGETAFGEQDVAQGIMAQAGLRVGTLVPALVTGIATYTLKGRVLPGSRV